MGALPRPDSFEKRPRAMPKRIACITPAPRNPPTAAWPLNAPFRMSDSVFGRRSKCITMRMTQPMM